MKTLKVFLTFTACVIFSHHLTHYDRYIACSIKHYDKQNVFFAEVVSYGISQCNFNNMDQPLKLF